MVLPRRGRRRQDVVQRLNTIRGHAFLDEDCTAFIERAFAGRRLFADSPLLQAVRLGARIGDPALPLLRPDAELDDRTRALLRSEALTRLPDALAHAHSPNVRLWFERLAIAAAVGGAVGLTLSFWFRPHFVHTFFR